MKTIYVPILLVIMHLKLPETGNLPVSRRASPPLLRELPTQSCKTKVAEKLALAIRAGTVMSSITDDDAVPVLKVADSPLPKKRRKMQRRGVAAIFVGGLYAYLYVISLCYCNVMSK